MANIHSIGITPTHARYALGYACTSAWAVVMLFSSPFAGNDALPTAAASMLPGLIACLASVFFFRTFPSIEGRTPFVTLAAAAMASGTFLSTYPALASLPSARLAGLVLSGFFAIVVIMSWFDAFSRFGPRAIVALAGCAISISAIMCWSILACSPETGSVLVSLLPVLSCALMPRAHAAQDAHAEQDRVGEGGAEPHNANAQDEVPSPASADSPHAREERAAVSPSVFGIVCAAVPVRTLVGLAITFFIISSLTTLAPHASAFAEAVTPASLCIPFALTACFMASGMFARKSIDSSLLYKILLFSFAACVCLLSFSISVSETVLFYAFITADAMIWMVLALLAKKTPVKPHLVFAIGWIAECAGNSLGQSLAPLFASHMQAFFAVAMMLILIAVGFTFNESSLMLDVDFEDDEEGEADASKGGTLKPATHISDEPEPQPSETDPLHAFAAAYGITPRERDVLELWLAGRGLRHIENTLFISESTVKSHLRSIYRKCDTHNRDEIIELFESKTHASEW